MKTKGEHLREGGPVGGRVNVNQTLPFNQEGNRSATHATADVAPGSTKTGLPGTLCSGTPVQNRQACHLALGTHAMEHCYSPFSKVFGGDLLSKEIVAIFLSILSRKKKKDDCLKSLHAKSCVCPQLPRGVGQQ